MIVIVRPRGLIVGHVGIIAKKQYGRVRPKTALQNVILQGTWYSQSLPERSTSTDRQVQTDDPDATPRNGIERNGLCLDPKKLAELGGLPGFEQAGGAARRRRATAEPAVRVAVAVVGARPAL